MAVRNAEMAPRLGMGSVSPSVAESLGMDLGGRHVKLAQAPLDRVHHRIRPAQVDVAAPDVRDHAQQCSWLERVGRHVRRAAAAHQVVNQPAALLDQLVDLAAEEDVVPIAGPIEQGQVAAADWQLLEQRPKGVIPIPPAIRSSCGRVRCAPVTTPYGPSAMTRVPTRIRWRSLV